MKYDKIFDEISNECKDIRSHIIIGLLQSIRDNRPIDYTTLDCMLYLLKKQTKCCPEYYTQDSIKVDTNFDQLLQNSLN